jgi:membrane protein YqaA with SNARE-associated domain
MLLLGTFAYCLASAVLPFLPAEAWVGGLAVHGVGGAAIAPFALAAAAGQMLGKTALFLAARGAVDSAWLRRRTAAGHRPSVRWARWCDAARRHEWAAAGLCGLSAFAGLPPFLAVSVLLGTLRMRLLTFVLVGLAGRFARFGLILAAPAVVDALR